MSQPCTSSSIGMISTARLAGSVLRPTATVPPSPRRRQAASAASAVTATCSSSGPTEPAAGPTEAAAGPTEPAAGPTEPAAGSPATEASSTMDRTTCSPTSPTVYSAHGLGRDRSSSVSRPSTARQAASVTAAQSKGPMAQPWTCSGLPASIR